jgi:hypothetical protein
MSQLYDSLLTAFQWVESYGESVEKIECDAKGFCRLKREIPRDAIDACVQHDLLLTGYFGTLLGAEIRVSVHNQGIKLISNLGRSIQVIDEQVDKEIKFLPNIKFKFIWEEQ